MSRVLSIVLSTLLAGTCVAAIQPTVESEGDQSASFKMRLLVADNKSSKPTGACYITAGTVTNCTGGMTQQSCYNVASKVGGVADWREGQSCK